MHCAMQLHLQLAVKASDLSASAEQNGLNSTGCQAYACQGPEHSEEGHLPIRRGK